MRDVLVCVVLFQLPIHIIWTLFARAVWWCVKVSCVHWINGQAVTLSDTRRVGGNSHAYLSESRIHGLVLIIYASIDLNLKFCPFIAFGLDRSKPKTHGLFNSKIMDPTKLKWYYFFTIHELRLIRKKLNPTSYYSSYTHISFLYFTLIVMRDNMKYEQSSFEIVRLWETL